MKSKWALLFLFFSGMFFQSLYAQDNLVSHRLGNFKSFIKQANGITINASNTQVHLEVYSPTIIRINISRQSQADDSSWAVIRQPEGAFTQIKDEKDSIVLTTDSLKVVVYKRPLSIEFYNASGKWLSGDDPQLGVEWQGSEVTDYRASSPHEKFIGLGEKTGHLNRAQQSYVNWNTDAYGYSENQDPIYSTMPFYMGIRNHLVYGLFFDNTYKSFFNFNASTDSTMSFFGAEGGVMNYYFFGASTVAGILKDYTWLTGRINMPPLWSLGYQQSRYSYMSQQQVLDIAHKMREDTIPCDMIYCDIDYMRGYRVFTWNPETFPHPKAMTDDLKAMGIHLATIIDPGIKIDSNGYEPYLSGMAHGYFARYPDGRFYTGSVWAGRSHFPDFIRKDVRQWWGNNFKILVDDGVTGFWNDMNEPSVWGQDIPPLIEFGSGKNIATLKEVRNVYGMQMARATYDGTKKLMDNKRPFILTRAAYSGIQRYSAMWTGDNNSTDEHMLLGFRLINSMGLTGMPFVGMDVGGFTGNPTPELMLRWMSLGTFMPMFRNHTAKGNTHHEPWAWGEFAEPQMRKDIELRYRLLPYLYSTFYESSQNGMPVNRSLAIHYTYDNNIYNSRFEDEFLFGKFMLVAPEPSTQMISRVYLPNGAWYRYSSDEKLEGGRAYDVPSPLDNLPVFIKAGAIIPMQSVIESTAQKGNGILYLNIWYGKDSSSFTYYEDDGTTYNYEKGDYYKRLISFIPGNKTIELGKVSGSYKSRFQKIKFILHAFPDLSQIQFNGSPVTITESVSEGQRTQSFEINNQDDSVKIRW
ncbi:MAG: glycoside hydrolase family 31 protein [Chitinophagaceae bacterium]